MRRGFGVILRPRGSFFRGANQGQFSNITERFDNETLLFSAAVSKYPQCLLGCTRRNNSVTEINSVLGSVSGISRVRS